MRQPNSGCPIVKLRSVAKGKGPAWPALSAPLLNFVCPTPVARFWRRGGHTSVIHITAQSRTEAYARFVPPRLKSYQETRDLHFITFSCYRRAPLLDTPHARRVFEQTLERVRRWYDHRG